MLESANPELATTVVIPCHNGITDTRACIQTLLGQAGSKPAEIILVDNASTDGTKDLASPPLCIRVLRQATNTGFAAAVNTGLAAAKTPLVLVLNNDTLAGPQLLARLQAALGSDPRIALVAPVSNHVKGPARMPLGDRGTTAEGRSEIEALLAQACPGKLEDVETLSGLCLLFRRSLLEEVPGFDAAFGLGNFEDDDFCLRVRLCGHRLVIARDAFVHHHGHRTFQALGIDYQAAIRDRQETFTKKWQHDAAGAAVVARLAGDWSATEAAARRALHERPAWPDAHFLLGRILASRGESAAAILHLQAFLARCPHHGEAAVLLGLQQLRQGESARGLETFRHAFADLWIGDELGAVALAQLARWCLDHKRLGEAVAHATDALELLPDDAGLRNLLGVTLMESGDLTRAEATFHSAVALANQDAKKNLGVCLWRQGQIGPALRAMAEAVAEHPGDSQALANLRQARAAAELVTGR